jgi:hypothetical protein
MKRSVILLAFIAFAISLSGQRSVDALFEKYSGTEGFVTVTISGDLLKLAKCLDNDDDDKDCWPKEISEIRILAQEDNENTVANFYVTALKELNRGDYEEFMTVKKSDQDIIMLVKADGNVFREFLIVVGGEDNVLVQIKGKMTFREARNFADEVKKENGHNLVINQD